MTPRGEQRPPARAATTEGPTPNVFVVGAPKSGTTALATYLGSHPDVFVAAKELSYFGSDLDFRTDRGEPWHISYRSYLGWFEQHALERLRVDRSVFYLYSAVAAEEIHAFDPDSRVIAMLRDPVDQMHAQHAEMLFQGDEDIADFGAALAAEEDRRRGQRVPPGCRKPFALRYRAIADYAPQLERYVTRFGRDRVCVVLYDDFVRDTAAAYRGVLEFLGLDTAHAPRFDVMNANKQVRSARARDLLRQAPAGVRRLGRVVVPNQYARAALRRRVHALNTRRRPRPPVDAELRRQLRHELAPNVPMLADLLGRDLSSWLAPDGRVAPKAPADGRR